MSQQVKAAGKSAGMDLNRKLPELPMYQSSIEKHRSPPSTPHAHSRMKESPTMSPNPTPTSASSKKQLQSTTRRLLMHDSPESQYSRHWPDRYDSVDPVKYSPPEAEPRYSSTTEEDPYVEHDYGQYRHNKIDDLLREYEQANAQISPTRPRFAPTKYQHKPKGMSQSMSENNLSFRRPQHAPLPLAKAVQPQHQYEVHKISDYGSGSPIRGRFSSRASSSSPIKGLEDIKEDETLRGKKGQMVAEAYMPTSPVKRSRSPIKQLFAEKGFLGRTTSVKELPSEDNRKKGMKHFGEKFKQRVGGMAGGVSKLTASMSSGELSKFIPASMSFRESPIKAGATLPTTSTFPVSLDPGEQSKFYAEAELMICATANAYLMIQKQEGRMSLDSIEKTVDFWNSMNRPQVIEFHFDQLTQRNLILMNIKTFRFYGPNAENAQQLSSMLNCWKALAKEMSVRTFCTGDSTLRQQIQNIYRILELLGAPMMTFLAFQQIQVKALAKMRDEQKKRDEEESRQFGVERKWEPPGGFVPRDSADSEAYVDPFANL